MKQTTVRRFATNISSLIATVAVAAFVTGCVTPLTSSKEALSKLKKDEGIIVGSALVNHQGSPTHSPARYEFKIRRRDSQPFGTTYTLAVAPNQERVFIGKLPEGEYSIDLAGWQVLDYAGLQQYQLDSLGANFQVRRGETTYIGKLVLNLPQPMVGGSRCSLRVQESQQEAAESLEKEYAEFTARISKNPMVIKSTEVVARVFPAYQYHYDPYPLLLWDLPCPKSYHGGFPKSHGHCHR